MKLTSRLAIAALWVLVISTAAQARERVFYYHNDHLGTPQVMTDQNGAVVWSAEYEPFGKATITTSTITNNLRFPGQYYDAETGLHYNLHRDYDPGTGRYLQPDPIGIDQGKNHLYVYVQDNPINSTDPLGLEKKCVLSSSNNVGATSTYGHGRLIGLHIPEANFLEFELPCSPQECCKATALEPRIKPTSVSLLSGFSKRATFLRQISAVTPCGRSGIARYEMESRAAVFGQTAVSLVELCYDCVQCK